MTTVEVPLDERWLDAAGLNPAEAQHESRLILAVKLFELRRLTLRSSTRSMQI